MGYFIETDFDQNWVIPEDKQTEALAAINALHTDAALLANARGGSFGGKTGELPVRERKWYSWVQNPPVGEDFETLEDAFDAWNFEYERIEGEGFRLTYRLAEKWGQEEIFLKAIAPFIKDTASCDVRGEEGNLWQWAVENGQFVERSGTVVYGT